METRRTTKLEPKTNNGELLYKRAPQLFYSNTVRMRECSTCFLSGPPRREPPTRCRPSVKTFLRTFRLLLNLISQFSNITLRTSSSTFYLRLDINLSSFQNIKCHRSLKSCHRYFARLRPFLLLHLLPPHALRKLGFHRISIASSRLTERGSWEDNQNILIQARWLANINPTRFAS